MKDTALTSDRSRHALSSGTLSLSIHDCAQDGLFQIAERQNPKRAFLFVSTVLGRHIPVQPAAHRHALRALAERVLPHISAGPVMVMSYAETAIGLGLGVFDVLTHHLEGRHMAYLPTTRFEPEGETPWFTMREEHSHAVDHLVFRPEFSKLVSELHSTLVLIDDETTTGKTFWGLAAGLASVGQSPENVILVTLTDWSNGSSRGAIEAVFPEAKVTSVSLLSGRFAWKPAEGVSPRPLPSGCAPCCTKWTPRLSAPFSVPRMGIDAQKHRRETEAFLDMMSCDVLPGLSSGARILVVGTGEHVWYPFLAAERIEAAGHETRFIATTRSPVAQGPIVPNQLRFSDHYGLGLTMYLNNVRPEDWDDILLFTETGVSGIDPDLCAALGKGQIIAADAAAHAMSGELK